MKKSEKLWKKQQKRRIRTSNKSEKIEKKNPGKS